MLKRLATPTACERAVAFGVFGLLSALLCHYGPRWQHFSLHYTLLAPALWLAIALCLPIALWISRSLLVLVTIALTCFVAWFIAYEATLFIHHESVRQIANLTHERPPGFGLGLNLLLAACGLIGGFLGSAVLVFGIAIAIPSFRSPRCWARVVFAGTIAGLLLEFAGTREPGAWPLHLQSFFPVYVAWQVAVTAAIGYGLKSRLAPALSPA